MPHATASDPMSDATPVGVGLSLEAALERLVAAGGALPVADEVGVAIIGWITDQDALTTYTTAFRENATVLTRDPVQERRRA